MSGGSPSLKSRPRASVIKEDSDEDDDDVVPNIKSVKQEEEEEEAELVKEEEEEDEDGDDDDDDMRGLENGHEDEEDDEEDDEDDEEAGVEPAMIDGPAESGHSLPSIENIVEDHVTLYSGVPYGIPDRYYVHKGKPLAFESEKKMNDMLNSKSADFWTDVMTEHITVIRSDDKLEPPDWWDGKPGEPSYEELPYQTFFYVNPYVVANPDNPEEVFKEECDKKLMRHLHKQLALKLFERFSKLKRAKDPEKRHKIAHILDWIPASTPQVEPKVAKWPAYKSVVLATAYVKRESNPRVKGPQKKGSKKDKEILAVPPVPKGGFLKRDREAETEAADSQGSCSTANAAVLNSLVEHDGGHPFKKVRTVDVANGAKTHCYVMGNKVYIVEH